MPQIIQLFKNLKLLPLKSQYIFPFYYMLPKIEMYMNRVQKFITLTLDLVLTYVLQLQKKTRQKGPFYFVIKVFNYLLISIKNTSHDIDQFRSVLKSFLLINSFTRWNILLGIAIEILAQCNYFKSKHLNFLHVT